jgi:hypothetical protein
VTLKSPHIALGATLDDALEIMRSLGCAVLEECTKEHSFRVDAPEFSVAIYPEEDLVRSVWYDDPIGRESEKRVEEKVQLYLQRYGALKDWEQRMDNGWMRYWFNPRDGAAMVYGVHNDVIRFNRYRGE